MEYRDLVRAYGSAADAAKALGIPKQTISAWKIRGGIPFEAQYRIQLKTRGKLKAELRA